MLQYLICFQKLMLKEVLSDWAKTWNPFIKVTDKKRQFLSSSSMEPGPEWLMPVEPSSCSHFEITNNPTLKSFLLGNFLIFCFTLDSNSTPNSNSKCRIEIFNFLLFFFIIDTSLTLAWTLQENKRIRSDTMHIREKELAEVFIKSYQNIKISVGGITGWLDDQKWKKGYHHFYFKLSFQRLY